MVDDLSLLRCKIQIAVYFVIEERANSGCAQPKRFGGQIEPLTQSARFEMRVAVAPVAMGPSGAIKAGNHRERHACIPCKILSET